MRCRILLILCFSSHLILFFSSFNIIFSSHINIDWSFFFFGCQLKLLHLYTHHLLLVVISLLQSYLWLISMFLCFDMAYEAQDKIETKQVDCKDEQTQSFDMLIDCINL